jgi:hypothetical protein
MTDRKHADYKNAIIYKVMKDDEIVYIDGTRQRASQRMSAHRRAATNPKLTIDRILSDEGAHNFSIALVESYPCQSADELKARVFYWIEKLDKRPRGNAFRMRVEPHTTCGCDQTVATRCLKRHYASQGHRSWEDKNPEANVRYLFQ